MKRFSCLLLLLAVISLMGAGSVSALKAADLSGNDAPTAQGSDEPAAQGSDEPASRPIDNERNAVSERKTRKGIGADFWGGPYWGYGPRWGHPCEACRASCEADSEGLRCERCRVRCGW